MSPRPSRLTVLALAATIALISGGCTAGAGAVSSGTAAASAPLAAVTPGPSVAPSVTPAPTAVPTPVGTRTIQTELGAVDVTGVPERVVVLEWGYLDMLFALGIEPTGLADIKGYNTWVGAGPRPAGAVTDVGLRGEPSIETVAGLEPDLIIDESWGYDYVPQLKELAPTLVYYPYPKDGESQFERMADVLRSLGVVFARESAAEEALTKLDAHIESAKATLAGKGLAGSRFAFIQAWGADDPGIRIFTKDSMVSQVLERLGLVNAWQNPGDYGFSDGSVEALATVQDATLLYIVQPDDDPITKRVASDPVWSALTFAKEGRFHSLGGDVWTFGGPLSLEQLVDRVVENLAGDRARGRRRALRPAVRR